LKEYLKNGFIMVDQIKIE